MVRLDRHLSTLRTCGRRHPVRGTPQRSGDADQAGETGATPSSTAAEGAKDLTGGRMVAHSPQDNQESEVAKDVDDKEDSFSQG